MMTKKREYSPHPASYRDPAGFVFKVDGTCYRQVNQSYASAFEYLNSSGLYAALTTEGFLIPHEEIGENLTGLPSWYKTLLPEQIPFVTYPQEWSPGQLKAAALLTLRILRIAIGHGMILKDATPYNIQYRGSQPVLIDSLSFEQYDGSQPWVAYRQFCENFLYPLYQHHYLGTGTGAIFRAYPEGIGARETARVLPRRSRINAGVWLHVFLPARIGNDPRKAGAGRRPGFSKTKMLRLANHLESIIQHFGKGRHHPSAWSNYYRETILSQAYLDAKEKLFREFIRDIPFRSALDLGCNEGYFTKILAASRTVPSTGAAGQGSTPCVIAVDNDGQSIDRLFAYTAGRPATHVGGKAGVSILPLCIDLAYPTPAMGFYGSERGAFMDRIHADLSIAVALVHHLALGQHIPLQKIAAFFSALTHSHLIIEFVPLADPKAQDLVRDRKGPLPHYDRPAFEACFGNYFRIEAAEIIPGTERILYRMRKKEVGEENKSL